jgi:hypothetical protein
MLDVSPPFYIRTVTDAVYNTLYSFCCKSSNVIVNGTNIYHSVWNGKDMWSYKSGKWLRTVSVMACRGVHLHSNVQNAFSKVNTTLQDGRFTFFLAFVITIIIKQSWSQIRYVHQNRSSTLLSNVPANSNVRC